MALDQRLRLDNISRSEELDAKDNVELGKRPAISAREDRIMMPPPPRRSNYPGLRHSRMVESGLNGRRSSFYGGRDDNPVATSNRYEEQMRIAMRYAENIQLEAPPLTTELLKKQQQAIAASISSTRRTTSRDDNNVNRSITSRTTKSDSEDGNEKVVLKGNAQPQINGVQIWVTVPDRPVRLAFREDGRINRPRHDAGSRYKTSPTDTSSEHCQTEYASCYSDAGTVWTTSTGGRTQRGATWKGAYTLNCSTGFAGGAPFNANYKGVREGREKEAVEGGVGRIGKGPIQVPAAMIEAMKAIASQSMSHINTLDRDADVYSYSDREQVMEGCVIGHFLIPEPPGEDEGRLNSRIQSLSSAGSRHLFHPESLASSTEVSRVTKTVLKAVAQN